MLHNNDIKNAGTKLEPGTAHWHNLYIIPLCAAAQETAARGFWDCSAKAGHAGTPFSASHTLYPRGTRADLHPWLQKSAASSAVPLPSLLYARGKAACHTGNAAADRQSCCLWVSNASSRCRRLTGIKCAGISQRTEGMRDRVTAQDKPYLHLPRPCRKFTFFWGNCHECFGFIPGNCLVCPFSSSPSPGTLTVVDWYRKCPCKGARFPRPRRGFTKTHSSRSCLPVSFCQGSGQAGKKLL